MFEYAAAIGADIGRYSLQVAIEVVRENANLIGIGLADLR